MYIGNAMKGNVAAVFAQLIINGESHGKQPPNNNPSIPVQKYALENIVQFIILYIHFHV